MKEFSQILKELRVNNNESQKNLADSLNVSFQSVSKWELGVHYPDVLMLQDIAKHYNVSIDYLLGNEEVVLNNSKTETLEVDVVVNEPAINNVWTDFLYNGKEAPLSETNKNRHAPGNRYLKTHPGPKDRVVIGVDSNSKICFLGHHINNRIPSCGPDGYIYTSFEKQGIYNDCFIVEDGYNSNLDDSKKFEFVIPQDGFVLVFPLNSIYAKKIMEFIVPKHLNKELSYNFPNLFFNTRYNNFQNYCHIFQKILSGELDNISVSLSLNKVVFEKEVEEKKEDNNFGLTDAKTLTKELVNAKEKIKELENEIKELRTLYNDIKTLCSDIECDYDDLDSRVCELESKVEELEENKDD